MNSDLQHDYQQWTKSHEGIKKRPPKEGHAYVKHAMNLFPILEGFAALNPIAQAVVATFKNLVTFVEVRKENDSRITILFVSQSEMMATLLDVDQLLKQRRARQEDEKGLHTDSKLEACLHDIEQEIWACGNTMDTFSGQSSPIKFIRAQDWRARILEHATNFQRFQVSIQQMLTIQIASDVGNLWQTMDLALSRFFAPKDKPQKQFMAKLRESGKTHSDFIQDTENLQDLIKTDEDSLSSQIAGKDDSRAKADLKDALLNQTEQLKKEIYFPLETLCKKNQERFELRLKYHTRQLQVAIDNSADRVIRSLSGPYDRLQNKDLKALWKEMNWIFCVDNNHFTSALFEYYRDHFTTGRDGFEAISIHEENDKNLRLSTDEEAEMKKENLTEVTTLTRLGVLNHIDAWTLDPIARYKERIISAIDCDGSGFIRISEINAFTDQMPEGWSLPQWCAYAALGEAYETRIYKRRIHNILSSMMEIQQKVLPSNRGFVTFTASEIVPFFQLLAWVPTASYDEPVAPTELRSLIHEKIKKHDDTWRQKLASLEWAIEDEETLKLLYGDETLEKYVLQLSFLLLENVYNVMQACSHVTIDIQEMSPILSPLLFLRGMCMKLVKSLRTQKSDLETFSGGIWYPIDVAKPDGDPSTAEVPWIRTTDVYRLLTDEVTLLQEFPLRPLDQPPQAYLKYDSWEEHVLSIPPNEIPAKIPYSWNDDPDSEDEGRDDETSDGELEEERDKLPVSFRNCNKCEESPIQGVYYGCTQCKDLDICSRCSQLAADEHIFEKHNFSHPMLRFSHETFPIQRDWLSLEARYAIAEVQQDMSYLGLTYRDDITKTTPFLCNKCENPISLDGKTTFYKCMHHSCQSYFLCVDCDNHVNEQIADEDIEGHHWWHSMLVLHRHMVLEDAAYEPENSSEAGFEASEENDDGDDSIAIISSIISEVKTNLDTNNTMLQHAVNSFEDKARAQEMRMSQLEAKVDGMVTALKTFLESQEHGSPKDHVSASKYYTHR